MNVAEVRPHRFTVDEYTRLAPVLAGQRTELVDGWVIDMAPIGTAHLTVVSRLQDMLVPQLQAGRVKVQQPLIVTGFDEPEPDVVILKEPLYLRKPTVADVELVIEVSDSTYTHDRDHKLPAYFGAGCPRVWLINISNHASPVVEIYANPARPTDRQQHGHISIFGGPSDLEIAALNLDELFDGVPELPADEYSEQP
jgi:Uma2 family endonuclease